MTTLLAILYRVGRWLRDHPVAAIAVVGAGLVAMWRRKARVATDRAATADAARVRAEDTAAVTTDAMERHAEGDRTREDVIDAARRETEAHPNDADAAARGARDFMRRRLDGVRAADADRGADPAVHRDATATTATRDRGR